MIQRSLFGEILDWMLTPLLLLWPISLALTWLVAQNIANKPFDRALEFNVQALAQLVSVQQQRAAFNLPQPAREILRADDSDAVYYQVLGVKGELLGGESALPLPNDTDHGLPGEVRLRDDELRGVPVRVAYTWVTLPLERARPALVQVAETREKRSVLATEIIKGVMLPQFVLLPLALLLVWMALVRGIKPLHRLEQRIRQRRSDDLSPLDDRAVPLEVAPLVQSVNDLLTRLNDSIATQKRFLADAAHQLKTPLAGLRMQADLAQREGTSTDDLKKSLQQIGRASIRATHTVNQLLALARAESGGVHIARQRCDLARLTLEVVQDCVPHALEKRIDLGYDGPPPGTPGGQLDGNLTLLKELVRNLVDNALNYTPSSAAQPGVVTVRVCTQGGQGEASEENAADGGSVDGAGSAASTGSSGPLLQVENSGHGIAAPERELVFQPFYRALGVDADGSGLGLPIVLEIARQHGASITLDEVQPGSAQPGVRFSVRFGGLATEAQTEEEAAAGLSPV